MIDLDPSERRTLAGQSRLPTFAIAFFVLAAMVGAGLYGWHSAQVSNFAEVYRDLGIARLPVKVELQSDTRSRLEQLKREPCYHDAIVGFANALMAEGYPRDADKSLVNFAKRCGGSYAISLLRYNALLRASDFPTALTVANEMVTADPANAQIRYSRGATYEQMKDFEHALSDYINAMQLHGDLNTISVNNFYDISRMYAALGRYCDAITPLETYISFDPATRRESRFTKLISDFADKGSCDTHFARGSARVARLISLGASNATTLAVTVNGVTGGFVLDTGASYVALTARFAAKAKVKMDQSTELTLNTVGGSRVADLGYADSVGVDKAQAQGVSVVVVRAEPNPFGARLDGLLGMSFLSRFDLQMSDGFIEIRTRGKK
jgi:clan AA aspartic protease (TIGR02281 family)